MMQSAVVWDAIFQGENKTICTHLQPITSQKSNLLLNMEVDEDVIILL